MSCVAHYAGAFEEPLGGVMEHLRAQHVLDNPGLYEYFVPGDVFVDRRNASWRVTGMMVQRVREERVRAELR